MNRNVLLEAWAETALVGGDKVIATAVLYSFQMYFRLSFRIS